MFLKLLTDSALTTSAGRLFQPLTTLRLKKYFLVSNLDLENRIKGPYYVIENVTIR